MPEAEEQSAVSTAEPESAAGVPPIVAEEEHLLQVILEKLDRGQRRTRTFVDDAATLIELRDALIEAKPEDQGSILEQMHRIEALSKQRGKGDNPPINRASPYFGHLRLEEGGKRRDVLIGDRGYVEPGGGVQIVDWRNAPVSRLYYRYEEGEYYEEDLGDRMVEGEIVARRTLSIAEAQLRRVQAPQGTFARDLHTGEWAELPQYQARLHVQEDGTAVEVAPAPERVRKQAAPAAPAVRGQLGVDHSGMRRLDRHLPAIAALIDPRQFALITRPSSGLIVVQGSAGSGKTTIGLHRIAYLAFNEPRRFRPERMMVVVYQRALASYVSLVLPSLGVEGVPVLTFSGWAERMRDLVVPSLSELPHTEDTPSVVMRAKAHGAMLRILADRQEALQAWCRDRLARELQPFGAAGSVMAAWDGTSGPADQRVTAFGRWVKSAELDPALRNAVETAGKAMRVRTADVITEWASLLTDRQALGEGFGRHAPGVFTPGQLDDLHRWCVDRERLRHALKSADEEDDEPYALDPEDDALLVRIHQLQRGPVTTGKEKEPVLYEHLMIDEVQDFGPIELAILLDSTTRGRSVTLAGDTAQAIAPEHGFSSWDALLDFLELPHERIEPLRVSYRSTREIVDVAEHALGPLAGDVRPVVPRAGAPVEGFGFASAGEASDFLTHALKQLMRSDPAVSVALIGRHPEQARLYHDALARAEIPGVRLVADQDFPFVAGIDITDVRQTKGLEFDIVILLDVNEASYPVNDDARRLLHVAMTRAAHQLWVTWTGKPSPLLPPDLVF